MREFSSHGHAGSNYSYETMLIPNTVSAHLWGSLVQTYDGRSQVIWGRAALGDSGMPRTTVHAKTHDPPGALVGAPLRK